MIPLKDNLSCRVFPWFTLLLLVLNGIAFAIELQVPTGQLGHFLAPWMVTPSTISHALATGDIAGVMIGLLTMVTASFLHGGWSHIIGNMVFLQAFALSVEARLGTMRFAMFYLLACLAAWGMFVFADPSSPMPGLGASAPIGAVIAAYVVFYPRARFKSIILVTGWPLWAIIPAWSFIGVWCLQQFNSAWLSIIEPGTVDGVAVWAHVGGALFGAIVAACYIWMTPDDGICYVPISCGHKCDNKSCDKQDHMQHFRFVTPPQWLIDLYHRVRLPEPPHKLPCADENHDHDEHK